MKIVLKCVALVLLLSVLVAPVFISLYSGKGLWPGLFVSLGIIGFMLSVIILRALWLKVIKKKTNDGILVRKGKLNQPEKKTSGNISLNWKNAVKKIKQSHLKQLGKPMYVLPWYLFIGATGSGKTKSIACSGLTPGFFENLTLENISDNNHCNFGFFEEAVILDTSGRYSDHQSSSDKQNWFEFLTNLVKYRKKDAVKGIVVTVSADSFFQIKHENTDPESDSEKAIQQGRQIRQRLDEIMQYTGKKVPVFFLVTKCDLIPGMTDFFDCLPQPSKEGVWGAENSDSSADPFRFVETTFKKCVEKLRTARLHIANRNGSSALNPSVLLFPQEFSRLETGLKKFVEECVGGSLYKEQPLIKGLFFVSSLQESSQLPGKFNSVNTEAGSFNSKSDSFFLTPFFKNILSASNGTASGGTASPTENSRQWQKRVMNLGLATWFLIAIAAGGFLSLSFSINYSILKTVNKEYATAPVLSDNVLASLNQLNDLKETALTVAGKNNSRWLPRFGLNHGETMEVYLKHLFCKTFYDDFLKKYDKKIVAKAVNFSTDTDPALIASTVVHLVRRINVIDWHLKQKKGEDGSEAVTFPEFFHIYSESENGFVPGFSEKINSQFTHYLQWADYKDIETGKKQLCDQLKHILTRKNHEFDWVIGWCNGLKELESKQMEAFWKGSLQIQNEEIIEAAYTKEGCRKIQVFFAELEKALEEPLDIAKKKNDFLARYQQDYIDEWYNFARAFPMGEKRLNGKEERLAVALKMGTKSGPYSLFFQCMNDNFLPLNEWDITMPVWISLVAELDEIKNQADLLNADSDKQSTARIAKKGLKFLGGVTKKIAASALNTPAAKKDPEKLMLAATAWKDYREALKLMAGAVISEKASFDLSSEAYGEDSAKGKSCVFSAVSASTRLKMSMVNFLSTQKTFTMLLDGPFDFLWRYTGERSACHLQKVWEETVLAEVDGVNESRVMNDLLLGNQGFVNKFIQGPAKPFISRNRKKGFYAKKVHGQRLLLQPSFLKYLTRAAWSKLSEKSSYNVVLKGMPTDVNSDATMIPDTTQLELECADAVQSLVNKNYPKKQTFVWSPGQCGDVVLKIYIGHITLTKKYSGFRPFARFLKDFAMGQHTFYRSDFPEKAAELKRMRIKYLKVKYSVKGAAPVIGLLKMSAGKVPDTIVSCSNG